MHRITVYRYLLDMTLVLSLFNVCSNKSITRYYGSFGGLGDHVETLPFSWGDGVFLCLCFSLRLAVGEQSEAHRGQVSSCSPARRSIPQGQPKSSDLECALCIR